MKDHLGRPQHDAGARAAGRENVKGSQLMIQPFPCKTDSNHQRCRNAAQRLVKVGAGLFRYVMQAVIWDLGANFVRQTVEIANNRIGQDACGQGQCGPSVGCHTDRRQRSRQSHIGGSAGPPADQSYWRCTFNDHTVRHGISLIFGNKSQSRLKMIPCWAQIRAALAAPFNNTKACSTAEDAYYDQ